MIFDVNAFNTVATLPCEMQNSYFGRSQQ